ncbi:MAG: hypothetical protein U1E59_18320 [Amaricoccus sp.]
MAKLTEALNQPEERPHASGGVPRMLIEKIVLTPVHPERSAIDALLYGDLGTIPNWVERTSEAGARNEGPRTLPGAGRPGGIGGCGGRQR